VSRAKSIHESILIVDDEPGITSLVTTILAGEGYLVAEANSPAEMESLLRTRHFGLVILDLMMPGVSGWELYARLRADSKHADTPVIILSARIKEKEIQDALEVKKVCDYITKPFSVEELVTRVKQALQ
jgi:two-component system response regulator VanR